MVIFFSLFVLGKYLEWNNGSTIMECIPFKKILGAPGWLRVEHLPLVQVVILGFWDQVPHQAPHRELLPLPESLPMSLALCLS